MSENNFQKILVPLDGSTSSTRGLNIAIMLAKQSGGLITGLNIISSSGFSKTPAMLKKYVKEMRKNSEKILLQAERSMEKTGTRFEGRILISPGIVKTIIGFAKSKKYDIIVMGSRGQTMPDARYLGSVANGVLHNVNIPVLIVK